jgi:hypothetical protein
MISEIPLKGFKVLAIFWILFQNCLKSLDTEIVMTENIPEKSVFCNLPFLKVFQKNTFILL